MNKNILRLAVLLFSLSFFAACSNDADDYDGPEPDVIRDIYPLCINFQVQDEQHNDLLNPDTSGSLAHQGIKAIFGGNIFEKDSIPSIVPSRLYMPTFYGLRSLQLKGGYYYLSFGEFAGTDSYTDAQLIIDWNDGTPNDTITFSNSFGWKNHEPDIHRSFSLNGKLHTGNDMIVITHP